MMTSVTQSNRVKIGIRPTIDGRRMGVRESLENQLQSYCKITFATQTVPSWNV